MGDTLLPIDLGLGRTALRIAAGVSHACAVLDNAQLKCWGLNNYGQLGQGDTTPRGDLLGSMGDLLPAIDLGF
jgi:alpha-tubulin suppressor-like RCC1 family protein